MSYVSEDASVSSSSEDRVESVDLLKKRLKTALFNLKAKEDLVKQHTKVTEEAIAGWEAAEKEAENYKQKAEASSRRMAVLEDRVSQLDGALKECLKQLREARDGQEEKVREAAGDKTKEFECTKIKFENQVSELRAMLQAIRAGPARPPDPVDPYLRLRVEALEKDNASLRLQLSSRSEELEVVGFERDLSTKAAESASKQLLEGLKRAAKLEAECRKLRATINRSGSANDCRSVASSVADTQSDSSERVFPDLPKSSPVIETLSRIPTVSAEMDLMDDFAEMERLASLPAMAGPTRPDSGSPERGLDAGPPESGSPETEGRSVAEEKLTEAVEKIEGMERQIGSMNALKLSMETELRTGKDEAVALSSDIESLVIEIERERAYVAEYRDKCRELELQLARKNEDFETRSRAWTEELKAKEDIAAGKLAECQKTISSLGMQLERLASMDEILVDVSGSF